jgi:hypothetical protein
MADMGFRENVMGPQPIAQRKPIPQDMLDTVTRFLDLLAQGKGAELAGMTIESNREQASALASAVKPGAYNDKSIMATARTNDHYWVKAKMTGPGGLKPFIVQLRLGPHGGGWIIWEIMNLTDARSAWSK